MMIELLHKQAAEIARAGHSGWGNTMTDAAAEIERLRAVNARMRADCKDAGNALGEVEAENLRLRAALQWIEDKARARKLEIAPSLLGTGFEFGFWPSGAAKVVNAKNLLDAVEAARA